MDSILELEKRVFSSSFGVVEINNSRILIKFDLSDISSSISSGEISPQSNFYLVMNSVYSEAIPTDYTVYAYMVSQSWDMGVGHKYNVPQTMEGVSWYFRDGATPATYWIVDTGSLYSGTSGSNRGGSTWYTGSASSQSFSSETSDLRMNVSGIVRNWLSGSFPNEGFLVMRGESEESGSVSMGLLQFYSSDSPSIYQPRLQIGWDDSSFTTGSLSVLNSDYTTVYFKNLQAEYKQDSKAKIRVVQRELYPSRDYATTGSHFTVIKYMPTSSYYSVRDANTEDIVVPFDDNYTKISCDGNGNYISLWLNGLEPERYYRFIIKTITQDSTNFYDNNYLFKIVR
jgi:hypothetical protein